MPDFKHKKIFLIGCIAVLAAVFFLLPHSAHAGIIGDIAYAVFLKAIAALFYCILWLFGWILWLAAQLLNYMLTNPDFQNFTKSSIVQIGWVITRDLSNMFFSLILIAISFATILKIDTYGVKQILPRLILVALLINFSLMIAGVIIDFSQVMTKYFVDAARGDNSDLTASLMNGLHITDAMYFKNQDTAQIEGKLANTVPGLLNLILDLFAGIALLLVASFVMMAGAIFMVVRQVALWFLLILAPLAWLFSILPNTRQYWNQWWSNFTKWAFFAPAYTFFIYLSLMAVQTRSLAVDANSSPQNFAKIADLKFGQAMLPQLMEYFILIGFLIASLLVAQKAGVWGASGAMAIVKGAGDAIGGAVSNWAARGAEVQSKDNAFSKTWTGFRHATSYLSPEVWKTAWKQRQAQTTRESIPVAAGDRQDLMNRVLTLSLFRGKIGEKTDYRERAVRAKWAEEEKNVLSDNAEEIITEFEEGKRTGNTGKMAGALRKLTKQNDQNEILRYYAKEHGQEYDMTAEGFAQFIEEQAKPQMGEQTAYRLGHDLNHIMESNGQYIGRMYRVDPKTGKYEVGLNQESIISHDEMLKANLEKTEKDKDKSPEAKEAYEKAYQAKEEFDKAFKDVDMNIVLNPKMANTDQLEKQLGKINNRKWKDKSAVEKKMVGDIARSQAHVEWSKQDPQNLARSTGRFSYIAEGYDNQGNTIDKGLTDSGKKKLAMIQASQANRMHTHSKAILLFKHNKDFQEINYGAYKTIEKDLQASVAGMTDEELEEHLQIMTANIPKLKKKEHDEAMEMLKKLSAEGAKQEGARPKAPPQSKNSQPAGPEQFFG